MQSPTHALPSLFLSSALHFSLFRFSIWKDTSQRLRTSFYLLRHRDFLTAFHLLFALLDDALSILLLSFYCSSLLTHTPFPSFSLSLSLFLWNSISFYWHVQSEKVSYGVILRHKLSKQIGSPMQLAVTSFTLIVILRFLSLQLFFITATFFNNIFFSFCLRMFLFLLATYEYLFHQQKQKQISFVVIWFGSRVKFFLNSRFICHIYSRCN